MKCRIFTGRCLGCLIPIIPHRTDTQKSDVIHCSVDEAHGTMFNREKLHVGVDYKGQVYYYAAGKSTTTCQLDMTYFPFDSQACYIELNRSELRTTTKVHQ